MSTLHWVALATKTPAGGATIRQLLRHFASLEAVFEASREALMAVKGVGPAIAESITTVDLSAVERDLAGFAQQGIDVITMEDIDRYPTNLLLISDAPPVLFVKGEMIHDDNQAVAIVGTRTPSSQGAALAHEMGCAFAARDWTVVSGLAYGVDAAAHRGALAGEEGRTVAVLGSGMLKLYPRKHTPLAEQIAARGAVLCEVDPRLQVSKRRLIARNRITSGLSRVTIVVEAGEDSGSISTARRAWRQGRQVYAVRGGDAGCAHLIEQGATPLEPDGIDWDALAEQIARAPITPPPPEQPPLF